MWSCVVTWVSKDQKHRAQPDTYLWDRSRGGIMKGVLGGERVGSYRLNHFLIVQQESRVEWGDMPLGEVLKHLFLEWERICIRSHSHTTAGPGKEPGLLVLCPELIPIPRQTGPVIKSARSLGGHSKWLSSSQECLYLVPSLKVLDTCPIDCHSLCFRAILDKKLAASVNILPKASSLWVLLWPVEGQVLAGRMGTELMGNCERTSQRHLIHQHFTGDLYSKEMNQCVYVILWTKAKMCCVCIEKGGETLQFRNSESCLDILCLN